MDYDLIVIGSGPGGYVAAIRASQLNLKTAIVERESLGGICLNWGCIPTKALLKSANVFEYIKYSQDYGIIVSESKINFDVIIKRSRDVANGMSRGVQFLMKKNKIDVIMGTARVSFVSPAAIYSTMAFTVTRIPRIVGSPLQRSGIMVIRSSMFIAKKQLRHECTEIEIRNFWNFQRVRSSIVLS